MSSKKTLIHKTSLVIGLASFLFSNAYASPFQAETLQTGYGNTAQTGGTTDKNSTGPATPHSYENDMTGAAPTTDGPAVASDSDTLGEYQTEEIITPTPGDPCQGKAVDGQCGMSGTGN